MDGLSREQKGLILDFYFHCGNQNSIELGRDLIAGNAKASQLYVDLEETLTGLDNIKYEHCPSNLVELTIARLKTMASSRQTPTIHNLPCPPGLQSQSTISFDWNSNSPSLDGKSIIGK